MIQFTSYEPVRVDILFKQLVQPIILFLALSSPAFSGEINIVGDIEQAVHLNHTNHPINAQSNMKHITLLEVELSDKAQHTIYKGILRTLEHVTDFSINAASPSSKKKQLGMNNVPVLDQGQHGTCVAFAVSAAIDAELGKGDYISQLCLLQLGSYLQQQGSESSGWNGSWGKEILNRIDQFGIINLADQRNYGCGGVKEYPLFTTLYTDMSIDEYKQYSEILSNDAFDWKVIFNRTRITSKSTTTQDAADDVKAVLDAGNRVAFGVLLPRADLGTGGAVAWHHYFSDTWVLTEDIAQELSSTSKVSSHEMVITGYDDEAVAMDITGKRHFGLFTLRNSWGSNAADWGDFYMSYDYFNALALEAYQIGKG